MHVFGRISGAIARYTRPCSAITGGFLGDELSSQAAIEKTRLDIWLTYEQRQSICVSLNLVTREGHSRERKFRATPGPAGESIPCR